jgi:DNA (cytosine-5)-methyltransferase 1
MVLLDLFCGAGGAAVGYDRAGFEVIGVDVEPQPDYPFEFVQDDALGILQRLVDRCSFLIPPDVIHASPPCQHHTTLAKGCNGNQADHPDLIGRTRALLRRTGLPYVIENVVTAPLLSPIMLCGEMFGLGVLRHRLFESNSLLVSPPHRAHRGKVAAWRHGEQFDGPYQAVYGTGAGTLAEWGEAMGIDWMTTRHSMVEAIPPAYTELIGGQLLGALRRELPDFRSAHQLAAVLAPQRHSTAWHSGSPSIDSIVSRLT